MSVTYLSWIQRHRGVCDPQLQGTKVHGAYNLHLMDTEILVHGDGDLPFQDTVRHNVGDLPLREAGIREVDDLPHQDTEIHGVGDLPLKDTLTR